MKYWYRYILLIAILGSIVACKDEGCMDIHYGDKNLTQVSKSYFAALEADVLIYKDFVGTEHTFEESLDLKLDRIGFASGYMRR